MLLLLIAASLSFTIQGADCEITMNHWRIFLLHLLTTAYYIRASPSEFVIALSKYVKAVYHTRVSVGMRFRMLFETEESTVRRYSNT